MEWKVLHQQYVKPTFPIPDSHKFVNLTISNLFCLNTAPIQKGLLYSNPQPRSTIRSFLSRLCDALATVLTHFYNLGGQLVVHNNRPRKLSWVSIDCNKGPGVKVTHVLAPATRVDDLSSPMSNLTNRLFDMGEYSVGIDCESRPFVSIQVTELVDGFFIGFSISHCVVDDTSFLHFMTVLSQVYNSPTSNVTRVPLYTSIHNNLFSPDFVRGRANTGDLVEGVFHFSPNTIVAMAEKVYTRITSNTFSFIKHFVSNNASLETSFYSLISFVWKSITRARNLSRHDQTACCLEISARGLFNETDDKFGNCISACNALSEAGLLLDHDISWATSRIMAEMISLNDSKVETIWKNCADLVACKGLIDFGSDINGPNGIVVGPLSRIEMLGFDFGLGEAKTVIVGCGYRDDGKVKVGFHENGVAEVRICLTKPHMDALLHDDEFVNNVKLTL